MLDCLADSSPGTAASPSRKLLDSSLYEKRSRGPWGGSRHWFSSISSTRFLVFVLRGNWICDLESESGFRVAIRISETFLEL
ncbi:unnamed protein product [Linum trigynum]|uniref:Uncharacterized protein n=1 Tax=Linum trigynum TaxID=586398 RepID=A0AAV2EST3_9ROSI